MFGKDFFIKKQRFLLFLLNNPLTQKWFRRILRIDSKERITEILPNSYSWGDRITWKKGKFYFHRTTDFRTHNKYSKRIFYAFRPLWILFHCWDILTRFKPAWNLGFDTFYPEAGEGGGNTTTDAYVRRTVGTGQNWAGITAGDGTSVDGTLGSMELNGSKAHSSNSNQWVILDRSIMTFDTSSISDGATVTATILSIKGGSKTNTTGGIGSNVCIYGATPSDNALIAAADFTQIDSTENSTTISYDDFTNGSYNDFTLNSIGKNAINLTGITRFGTRSANHDVANSAPTWTSSGEIRLFAYSADTSGTASDPKLVVTYAIIISPPAGTVTLTGQVPTLSIVMTISTPAGTITITGQIPTVTKSGGWDLQDKSTSSWTFTPKS